MTLREEIIRSLFAAWRIARFDANAMGYFNLSLQGFWRSFIAALIVLPAVLLLSGLDFTGLQRSEQPQLPPTPSDGETATISVVWNIVSFACRWAAWPLLMIPLARFFKLQANYVPYIIAANWGAVLQAAVILAALVLTQVLPMELAKMLVMVAYITVLYYAYLVTKAGLQCDTMTAIGLVILNTVVEIGIARAFGGAG